MTSEGGKELTTGERSGSEILRCSFCNKSQAEVRKLIAGPDVFICDECVGICLKIIGPAFEAEDDLSLAAEGTEGVSALLCNLCRLPTPVDQLTPIPRRGALCRACIDAVRQATDPSSELGS